MSEHVATVQKVAPTIAVGGASGLLQRKCNCGNRTTAGSECKECARHTQDLHRKESAGASHGEVPEVVYEVLRSSGVPLDASARADMEPRFGRDLSGVRIHADARAAASANVVGALAYTVGDHIAFAGGQFAPASPAGRHLLAHELAHTVQQAGGHRGVQTRLAIGMPHTSEEREADRVADRALAGDPTPDIGRSSSASVLRRQVAPTPGSIQNQGEPDFRQPQRRGGPARSTSLDAGKRGDDIVRVAVTRYLCDCTGRNVTQKHASAQLRPTTGFTLEICNGRVTARLVGTVEPSSLTTGTATLRGEVNLAPGTSGPGVRGGVEGVLRNTGNEPQYGGRADVRVGRPGSTQVGAGGEIMRGSQSGQVDTSVGVGVDIRGVRVGAEATNLQDARRGGRLTFEVPLPGQDVENKTCKECRCPISYECKEDIPPRDYEESVTYDVEDRTPLRYYFSLDSNHDTTDSVLRGMSTKMLDEVATRIAAGARIRSIVGYASPEDNRERPTPNEELSRSRALRVHDLLAGRLGASIPIPPAQAGGELLGRHATIAAGSRLADAILDAGFKGPEEVSDFLIGSDISNQQLADQFLGLLGRVSEPTDRLRLFGVDGASPAASRLLAAIDRFIRNRGRGPRPWEEIFAYLRFATVVLSQTRQETRAESKHSSGTLTAMNDGQCKRYAERAESEGRFGATDTEPQGETGCPVSEPRNLPDHAKGCDYS